MATGVFSDSFDHSTGAPLLERTIDQGDGTFHKRTATTTAMYEGPKIFLGFQGAIAGTNGAQQLLPSNAGIAGMDTNPSPPLIAIITLETTSAAEGCGVRFRYDGEPPTALLGEPWYCAQFQPNQFVLGVNDWTQVSFILTDVTKPVNVNVHWAVPALRFA